MAQLTDPFMGLNWGWDNGESGWGEGMNETLIKNSFFHNKRIDGIVGSLPGSPSNGQAYFLTSDNNIYLRAEGSWYNSPIPVGFEVILKSDESRYRFTGGTLELIPTVDSLQGEVNNINSKLVNKVQSVATIADLRALTGLQDGQRISITCHTTGTLGSGEFVVVGNGAVDDNGRFVSTVDGKQLERLTDHVTPYMYGAVADDSTDDFAALEAACLSDLPTKITSGTYAIDLSVEVAIYLPSNKTVDMDADVTIRVLDGAGDSTSVFRIWEVENVFINGNGGTIVGDNETRVGVTEAQHGVFILESSVVRVSDLNSRNFQGDGIYVGAGSTPCELVVLENCHCENNSRQGISVTHADGVLIKGGSLTGNGSVNGASPRAGLDLEPNTGEYVANVSIFGTHAIDNVDGGFLVQDGNGPVSDVSFDTVLSRGNGATWGGLFVTSASTVDCINSIFDDNASWGVKYQSSASDSEISGNVSKNNTTNGYEFVSVSRLGILNNLSISNGTAGYAGTNVQKCNISKNRSYDDTSQGFFFSSQVRDNEITENRAEESGQEGFYFFDRTTNNLIKGNRATACGRTTTLTYGAFRFRTEFADNIVEDNRSELASSGNQVSYGCIVDGTTSINNTWRSNRFAGGTAPMNFTSVTAQTQIGITKSVNVGSYAAGVNGANALFSADGGNGIYITEAAILNTASITNDATNYTTFDIQNKGSDGSGTSTIFSSSQWTRTGFAPINIFAYDRSTFDLLTGVHVTKGNVLGFTKTDSGTGAALTGATIEVSFIEY